jgi:ribosomal protein S18 acetylase RimI-like enzyme
VTDDLYWAKPLPIEALKKMLSKAFCFGLYPLQSLLLKLPVVSSTNKTLLRHVLKRVSYIIIRTGGPQQIWLSRWIIDEVAFAYLAVVHIDSDYQGRSLDKWTIECCRETLDRYLAKSKDEYATVENPPAKAFYSKYIDTKRLQQDPNGSEVLAKKESSRFVFSR